jgi:hypothetical protein
MFGLKKAKTIFKDKTIGDNKKGCLNNWAAFLLTCLFILIFPKIVLNVK